MTDIPSDIMERARKAIMAEVQPNARWQYADGRCDHFAVVRAVAKAILAERERCAKIAERFGAYPAPAGDGCGTSVLAAVDGRDIAAAIRSGK